MSEHDIPYESVTGTAPHMTIEMRESEPNQLKAASCLSANFAIVSAFQEWRILHAARQE